MRTRTSHSDSIVSEATRYDAAFAILPFPLVVGATVGTFSPLPISPVMSTSGLILIAVLAYGLFVATLKSVAGSTSGPGASVETDIPFDGVTTRVRNDAGRNRRHGSV